MTKIPPAEVQIDADLVKSLIKSQHPDLSDMPLEFLDEGWDNSIFKLGSDLLVRLPRREVAAQNLRNEQKWLPALPDGLPIDIPVAIRIGQPEETYPWHWSIVPHFKGVPASEVLLSNDQAVLLARFLKILHSPAPVEAPSNPLRGVHLEARAKHIEERLLKIKSRTNLVSPGIEGIWQEALKAQKNEERVWIHGDLHPKNIINIGGTIKAIIDWGDVTSGDAATDLACFWMLFSDSDVRRTAIEEYGLTGDLFARAKGWAVFFGTVFLGIGWNDLSGANYARIGEAIMRNLEADFC